MTPTAAGHILQNHLVKDNDPLDINVMTPERQKMWPEFTTSDLIFLEINVSLNIHSLIEATPKAVEI